jgi:hypothetical protein
VDSTGYTALYRLKVALNMNNRENVTFQTFYPCVPVALFSGGGKTGGASIRPHLDLLRVLSTRGPVLPRRHAVLIHGVVLD